MNAPNLICKCGAETRRWWDPVCDECFAASAPPAPLEMGICPSHDYGCEVEP